MSKYHNIKSAGYDSSKEARRAAELRLLERAGEISGLREQVRYELIPAQYDKTGKDGTPGASPSRKAPRLKLLERKCEYVADFVYTDNKTGETVVEDVKGGNFRTPEYVIKRKLMLFVNGIRIKEV